MTAPEAIEYFSNMLLSLSFEDPMLQYDYDRAMELAIKALEKQVPQNPEIRIHLNRVPEEESQPHCPNCNEDLEYIIDLNDFRHCPYCGQAIEGWDATIDI